MLVVPSIIHTENKQPYNQLNTYPNIKQTLQAHQVHYQQREIEYIANMNPDILDEATNETSLSNHMINRTTLL